MVQKSSFILLICFSVVVRSFPLFWTSEEVTESPVVPETNETTYLGYLKNALPSFNVSGMFSRNTEKVKSDLPPISADSLTPKSDPYFQTFLSMLYNGTIGKIYNQLQKSKGAVLGLIPNYVNKTRLPEVFSYVSTKNTPLDQALSSIEKNALEEHDGALKETEKPKGSLVGKIASFMTRMFTASLYSQGAVKATDMMDEAWKYLGLPDFGEEYSFHSMFQNYKAYYQLFFEVVLEHYSEESK